MYPQNMEEKVSQKYVRELMVFFFFLDFVMFEVFISF